MKARTYDLVVAFHPHARGFAYVVFEGAEFPVDWGISDVLRREGRVPTCVRRLSVLIDRYRPDALVLRATREDGRAPCLPGLVQAAEALAASKGAPIHTVSRAQIRRAFAHLGSPTRYA